MTAERTLLITTHQVDEIEFMLSDIMFIRDGELILHLPMEDVPARFTQLIVQPDKAERRGRCGRCSPKPASARPSSSSTAPIARRSKRSARSARPPCSDLFVALMSRETGVK